MTLEALADDPKLGHRSVTVAELVDRIRRQASADIEDARPLPAQCYIRQDFYQAELDHVLSQDWQAVARVEQVPNVGDYVTVDLPDEPIVVVRGQDNVVRVLSRVCRHRYADVVADTRGVVPASGCLDNFQCPYHLWSYRLDGSLINAVDFAKRERFDKSQFALREIRSEIWQGFVFVNLSAESTQPLGMEPIARALGNYDYTNYRIVRSRDWGDLDAGWKVVIENFLECYHHLGAHVATLEPGVPALSTVCADGSDGTSAYYARCMISAETAGGEVDGHLQMAADTPVPEALTPYERSFSMIATRFPYFMLATSVSYVYWMQAIPTGPETHRLIVHALAPVSTMDQLTEADHDTAMEDFDSFQIEDVAANGRVQASMHSRFAVGGAFHEQEFPLLLLQRYLAEMFETAADV